MMIEWTIHDYNGYNGLVVLSSYCSVVLSSQ